MNPALDLSRLPPPAQKVLDPSAPAPMKAMAAKGIVPGLKPGDVVAVVAALSESADAKLAEAARATLAALPPPVLLGALSADLEPGVVDLLASSYAGREEVLEKLLGMPRITAATVEALARTGSERTTELIATNETRLLAHPTIIERLYMNKNTRMSTADRLIDLAVRNGIELKGIPAFREAVAALENELIPEPSDEPSPDDLAFIEADEVAQQVEAITAGESFTRAETGEEAVKQEALPLHARLANLPISGKIRRAQLGTSVERNILLRDTNKLVASAAIRSPMVQESDVERIAKNRNVHEEVLRIIATNGGWLENHIVKYNLVCNPRTPFSFSSRLVLHLRDHELKSLEKSRDVPAPVRAAAKQQLQRKTKGKGG
jgi:hypothetical protein